MYCQGKEDSLQRLPWDTFLKQSYLVKKWNTHLGFFVMKCSYKWYASLIQMKDSKTIEVAKRSVVSRIWGVEGNETVLFGIRRMD